jgi:sugar phosphate permease
VSAREAVHETALTVVTAYRRRRLWLLCLLFGGYVGYYFCRVTLPVTLPFLESSFGYTKTQTGLILSTYYLVYAIAKMVNGFLGDRVRGKIILLVGLFGSAACNLLFGFGTTLAFFIAVWGLNAYFQSMGWPSMISILSRWYRMQETGKALGILSLSYLLGDFIARSSAGMVLSQSSWPVVFWFHAALLGSAGVALFLSLSPLPASHGLPDLIAYDRFCKTGELGQQPVGADRLEEVPPAAEYRRWISIMLRNGAFWVVCMIGVSLSIIRYVFWGWSVQYLMDSGAGIATASMASAVFPLFGCIGTILAGWISDRMGARRGPVMVVMCVMLSLSTLLFSRIAGHDVLWLTVVLACIGFSLYGPYSMLAGAIAMDFGSRYSSATAAGIIDAAGAFGTIATGVGMGYLIDRYGWDTAFLIVVSMALIATLSCLVLWNAPSRPAPVELETAGS